MVFGESFQEPAPSPSINADEAPQLSGMWRAVRRGTAKGRFAIVSRQPFAGVQSQQMSFDSGEGQWGMENQGLNRWGMDFVAGKPYEGYVWVRAEKTNHALCGAGKPRRLAGYAERRWPCRGNGWRRLDFTLTPSAADRRGRFALELEAAGVGNAGPRVSPTRRVGPIQGAARPPRCRRGTYRPRHHRAPLRRFDGQQRRIPMEKDDRPARPPPAVRGHLVSHIPPTAGAFWTSWISARRPASNMSPPSTWARRPRTWPTSSNTPRDRPTALGPQARGRRASRALPAPLHGTRQRGTRRREIRRQVRGVGQGHLGQGPGDDPRRRRFRLWRAASRTPATSAARPPASPALPDSSEFCSLPSSTIAKCGSTCTWAPTVPAAIQPRPRHVLLRRRPGQDRRRRQAQGGGLRVQRRQPRAEARWPTPWP